MTEYAFSILLEKEEWLFNHNLEFLYWIEYYMIYWSGGVYELVRVYKSINLEEQSPLKVFEGTVEGSVDS